MYLFFFFSQATGQTDQCTVNDDGSWISILVSGHSDYTGAQLEVTNVHEVYSPQGEGELNAKCKYIPLYFRCSNKLPTKYIIQGVQFVRLENKIFVIDISEPKQSHKVNEISQIVIDDSINKHNNGLKMNIINVRQQLSSNFVIILP